MALQDKYAQLIAQAKTLGTHDLQVREENNVLYIDGEVASGAVKDQLWNIYEQIDPNYSAGDLVLDVKVAATAVGTQYKVTTETSNLNVRKGPGTDQPIIGKAAHHSIVTLLNKYNEAWALIRTETGEEGYVSSQYLTQL